MSSCSPLRAIDAGAGSRSPPCSTSTTPNTEGMGWGEEVDLGVWRCATMGCFRRGVDSDTLLRDAGRVIGVNSCCGILALRIGRRHSVPILRELLTDKKGVVRYTAAAVHLLRFQDHGQVIGFL